MYLFLDTETTGVSSNSRIVSICWHISDLKKQPISTQYHIIYPQGFTIPDEAAAIHGITTAVAKRKGIPLEKALGLLCAEIAQYSPALYVGHNVSYDRPILMKEYARVGMDENFSKLPTFCTMQSATNYCKIKSARGGYKWPKLDELHHKLFGTGVVGAHNAQADVQACARCFFKLREIGIA